MLAKLTPNPALNAVKVLKRILAYRTQGYSLLSKDMSYISAVVTESW